LVGDVGYQRDVSAKALQRAKNLVDDNGLIVNCFGARFLSLAPERASLGEAFSSVVAANRSVTSITFTASPPIQPGLYSMEAQQSFLAGKDSRCDDD
jgi:hypothetical protein